jgi:nicotinate-nucleotide pyrophosphorylase (carboxylating)
MVHQWHGTLELIQRALAEDAAISDATTALLPAHLTTTVKLQAQASGTLAGIEVALSVFREIDPLVQDQCLVSDGSQIVPGQTLATIEGLLSSILRAERTALNFLQRMSGVATAAHAMTEKIYGLPTLIVDTRKTIPGWRSLDKYAVRMGGARNHRMNLSDGVLIKDNHIAAMAKIGVDLPALILLAKTKAPHTVRIEVEVETLEQADQALTAGADILLLDNMALPTMRAVVKKSKGKAITEASGGITLETVRRVAETGVDLISVGSITHSAKALDINLEILDQNQ